MNWFLATTVTQHVYLRTYIISYIIKKKKKQAHLTLATKCHKSKLARCRNLPSTRLQIMPSAKNTPYHTHKQTYKNKYQKYRRNAAPTHAYKIKEKSMKQMSHIKSVVNEFYKWTWSCTTDIYSACIEHFNICMFVCMIYMYICVADSSTYLLAPHKLYLRVIRRPAIDGWREQHQKRILSK